MTGGACWLSHTNIDTFLSKATDYFSHMHDASDMRGENCQKETSKFAPTGYRTCNNQVMTQKKSSGKAIP